QAARDERYESLRGFFHGASDMSDGPENLQLRLHTVVLGGRAKCLGKSLEELNLLELEVDVTAIRRGKNRLAPEPSLILQEADVVVLRGSAESVARAELRLVK
ncbi:MAG: TrkA C-terminal domain-containing protein, partial [Burkholderiales bacterium]|nr:TrkA C-terminal domain-containing protein [Burkholderiales bacterium]